MVHRVPGPAEARGPAGRARGGPAKARVPAKAREGPRARASLGLSGPR